MNAPDSVNSGMAPSITWNDLTMRLSVHRCSANGHVRNRARVRTRPVMTAR